MTYFTLPTFRATLRALASCLTALVFLMLVPATAHAHVTVTPTTAPADSYAVLTFAVPHGCDGADTTELTIKMPETVSSVTPTVTPGWGVTTTMEKLDTPVDDGHGGTITERVDKVIYTADTALPDNLRAAFEISVRLPDAPGEPIAFPVVQTCGETETAWIEQADDTDANLAHPAPLLTLVAASQPDTANSGATAATNEESLSQGWLWLAVALGAIGTALGGVALTRSGRSR